jgi:DNA polymerase III subunit epsilon
MSWHTQPVIGYDCESTGLNIEADRIVTAAIITYHPTEGYSPRTWLANPGIEIPEAAEKVHGISTAKARAEGRPAAEVVGEIASHLADVMSAGVPVVAMNGRFDLTILDRECRRHGLPTLEARLGRPVGPVIDPLVLDKAADKYRKGSRKLEALAAHYGVELTDAHTADADALAAVQVALVIAEKYPALQVDAHQLHGWQIKWAAEQARSFRAHRAGQGLPVDDIREEWPLVPFTVPAPVPHQPARGDAVEGWLKQQRDRHLDGYGRNPEWYALDGLLDEYRLHAATGTPLGEHVCEGQVAGDCDCLEQPTA